MCLLPFGCTKSPIKTHRYKYAKKSFSLESLYSKEIVNKNFAKLDTTTYYYNSNSITTVLSPEGYYHILKFHSDGRVQSVVDSVLSDKKFKPYKELESGNFNYYKIVNDSIIKMEVWRDTMAGMGYWQGIVYSDSIVFNKTNNLKSRYVLIKK